MTFDQAERLFYQMEAQYRAGQLSEAQYQAEIGRLRVIDPQGNHWQLQEHTGRWHVYQQGRWQPATPPGRMPPAPPAWGQRPESPSTPPSTQQTLIQRSPSPPAQPPTPQPWGQGPPSPSTPSSTQQTLIQRSPSPPVQPPVQQPWDQHSASAASAPTPSSPPWAQRPAYPTSVPAGPGVGQAGKRRRRLPILLAVGLAVVSVVCAGALCVGYRFYIGSSGLGTSTGERAAILATPTPEPEAGPRPDVGYEARGTTSAPAGSVTGDEHGARLNVPGDTLPGGEGALLIASAIKGKLADALEENYTLDTPFYIVSAAGEHDGRGRATLSLPAPSPHSRLLAMVDGIYPALLNTEPQDGVLSLEVRLGSSKGEEVGAGATPPRSAIRYAVVTPKATGLHSPVLGVGHLDAGLGTVRGELRSAAGVSRQSGLTGQASGEYVDCAPRNNPGAEMFSWCRSNSDGTIIVTYPVWGEFTPDQADQVIAQVQDVLTRFGGLGFGAVRLSFTQRMYVTIQRSGEDLQYSSVTGVLYVPAKFFDTKPGSAPPYDFYHELAHWIQDEEYSMTLAMVSNPAHRWWLEIAAELMVMLIEPSYIEALLDDQGDLPVGADNALSIQLSPYQWPGNVYGHAHQVMFNMCDDTSVCPLSQAQFVQAINKGTFPFDAEDARRRLSANLGEYAHYLAGGAPQQANTGMPQTGRVATGDGYGDYIECKANNKGEYRLLTNGVAPNIRLDKSSGTEIGRIDALLQKDGVYPLRVAGGRPGSNESLPLALTVEPGASLWYRRGIDKVGFHDGTEGLVLQPIHTSMGLESARLVAFGQNGGERVRGQVRPVDLSGAMVIEAETELANRIICTGDTGGDPVESDVAQISAMLSSVAIAMGDFKPGDTPGAYKWELVPARVSKDASTLTGNVEGSMAFEPDQLVLKATYKIPQPESGALPGPDALALLGVLAGIVPLACLGNRGNSRRRAVAAALLGTALLLSSCLTDLEVYGQVQAEIRFRELEYVGGNTVPTMTVRGLSEESTAPVWRLSDGIGSYVIDFTATGTKEDAEGNQIKEKITCTGMADLTVTAEIYENLAVKAEP